MVRLVQQRIDLRQHRVASSHVCGSLPRTTHLQVQIKQTHLQPQIKKTNDAATDKQTHLKVLQRLGAQAALVFLPRPLAPLRGAQGRGSPRFACKVRKFTQQATEPAAEHAAWPALVRGAAPGRGGGSKPAGSSSKSAGGRQQQAQPCLHEYEALQQEVAAEGGVPQLQAHQPAARKAVM